MIYDVDLDDGRTVTLEADNPPSEQDIYAALQSYQPPAPRPQLQPGDLAGPEARQIPDLTTTTRGGPPAKLSSFAETIQEPLALAPEMLAHEGITLPGLSETIKKAGEQYIGGLGIRGVSTPTPPEQFTPAQKLASGAIQGVGELVEGVANFLSSSQGIAETGAAASPIAPAVYLKWANDMVRGGMLNAGEAYDAYKRGDWETFAKQVTGGLGMLLGAGAVTKHGVNKIAEPIQAFTGGTSRLEEANAKALAATIPPEIPSITKAEETYASPIRSDTGQILEAGKIPETSENVSGQNLQLAPPGQPEPVVPRVEQRPQAEVLPAEQPSEIVSENVQWKKTPSVSPGGKPHFWNAYQGESGVGTPFMRISWNRLSKQWDVADPRQIETGGREKTVASFQNESDAKRYVENLSFGQITTGGISKPTPEVLPPVEPPKVEADPIDRAQRYQDLKQAEAEGRLDEEGAAELADLIAADEAAKAEQKRIATEFKASQETTSTAPPSETAAVPETPVSAEPTAMPVKPERGLPETATESDLMSDMTQKGRDFLNEVKSKPDEFSPVDATALSQADRRNLARLGVSFSVDRQNRILGTWPSSKRAEALRQAVQAKSPPSP